MSKWRLQATVREQEKDASCVMAYANAAKPKKTRLASRTGKSEIVMVYANAAKPKTRFASKKRRVLRVVLEK